MRRSAAWESARTGALEPAELRGSTFTVTSAGKLAGLFQTPLVNHPEVAILSIGRIAERPVVREGEVVARRTGTIASLSTTASSTARGGRVRAVGDRATRERRLGNHRRRGGDRSARTGSVRGDHEHAERGARVVVATVTSTRSRL